MASTITRIFDKHPLRGERDILFIGEILDAKLHDYMEGAGQNLPSDVQEKLSIVMNENYEHMKHFIGVSKTLHSPLDHCSEEDSLTTPGGGILSSPMLPPLSPPPVDSEVTALEAQVEEATQRVSQLRVTMQAQVQDLLAQKLAASRPTADIPAETSQQHDVSIAQDPSSDELRQRLADASGKIPTLLAQLEDAHSRLDKLTDTINLEATGQRQPPNTIERAVLGIPDEDEDVTEQVSPALKHAMQAGQIVTRRGRDIRPVSFPSDEAHQ